MGNCCCCIVAISRSGCHSGVRCRRSTYLAASSSTRYGFALPDANFRDARTKYALEASRSGKKRIEPPGKSTSDGPHMKNLQHSCAVGRPPTQTKPDPTFIFPCSKFKFPYGRGWGFKIAKNVFPCVRFRSKCEVYKTNSSTESTGPHQRVLHQLFDGGGQVRDDLARANPCDRDFVDRLDTRLLHYQVFFLWP